MIPEALKLPTQESLTFLNTTFEGLFKDFPGLDSRTDTAQFETRIKVNSLDFKFLSGDR